MPNPSDMQPWLDQVKRELENVVFSPPDWVVNRLRNSLAEAIAKAIPECFAGSIHEVIEKSVEKSLSDVVSRHVGQGVEKAIRPLVEEIALLRIAIEHGQDADDWWRHGQDPEADEDPEG